MSKQFQLRRGTDAQIAAFTPAEGEAVYNTDTKALHIGDGVTLGGFPIPSLNRASRRLSRFRLALAKTASGQANTSILALGDSTVFGAGSTNQLAEPNLNVWRQSFPQQLAIALTDAGILSTCNGITTANPDNSWNLQTSDGRLSFGSSWGLLHGTPSIGGGLIQAQSAGGNLVYTPATQCDTYRVWYVQNTSLGTMGLAVGTGAVTNKSTSGQTGFKSVTVSGALGQQLILSWVSGLVFVGAIEGWDSTKKVVTITNGGWPGGKLADISQATPGSFGPLPAAITFAPDLYIVDIGINDWGNGTPLATFKANLTPFLAALQAQADVLIASPAPSSVSGTGISDATQQGFVSVMRAAAVSLGIPFVDVWNRWGDWNGNQAMYGPGTTGFIHPNMIGYADYAGAIARVLATA